ncbi:hypothetical protein BSZ19_06155 [Bradyrhizobium japonicum]|uniref:Uncharacterized protein n=1 Tax=Bradyrhizobium japonicum TaxID=375 RepID=A0A1Y2JV74_BRAJP|nr:hypothetical protein BSZ19_06155 [Bradyrhizobium japonicum]
MKRHIEIVSAIELDELTIAFATAILISVRQHDRTFRQDRFGGDKGRLTHTAHLVQKLYRD